MNKHPRDPEFLAHLGGLAGAGLSRVREPPGESRPSCRQWAAGPTRHWLAQEGRAESMDASSLMLLKCPTPRAAGQGCMVAVLIAVLGVVIAPSVCAS